jgi:hypothetical protein
MKRPLCCMGAIAALMIGCSDGQEPLGLVDARDVTTPAGVEAASAPTAFPILEVFVDLNPCSGLDHTVTVTGTAWIHDHQGRQVIRFDRTISTSSGFQGRGTVTFVSNGNIEKISVNDMLTHESGARIRPHFVGVFDLLTVPATVRVFRGTVTCVRS